MSFLLVDLLVRFAESPGFCSLWANGLFHTVLEPAVVVGRACISKTLNTPCHASW